MKRRSFIQGGALFATAVMTTGFVRYDGRHYVGDCQTTTDILGPFYRPDAPLRSDLRVPGTKGREVLLEGIVKHDDCVRPLQGAKVELWHCSPDAIYDNSSDDYLYRGTAVCDAQGKYHFRTQLPVPYDVGDGSIRPAHFHMLISAGGYQSLVTQLYFTGDPHLADDPSSAAPEAKHRILNLQEQSDGPTVVAFDVVMSEHLPADPIALDKIAGTYVDDANPSRKMEFIVKDNQLWMTNEVFGHNYRYVGNNSFKRHGLPIERDLTLTFKLIEDGGVKLKITDDMKDGKVYRTAKREGS